MPTITLLSTRVSESRLRCLAGMLDAQEQNRLRRLRRHQDQRRYVVAHAGLRRLLADRLNVSPLALSFMRGEYGKPELADVHLHGVHFNLSHANELVAVAVADSPVGVDIEHRDALIDPGTADLVFTDEEKRRCRSNADRLRIWTAKEAVIKACGLGMSLPLRRFSVAAPSNTFQPITCHAPIAGLQAQMVANFDALPGYYGAVSIQGSARPVAVHTLDTTKMIGA